ncbi:hypothetical protein [Sinorhizobium chiapasense]|uniref:Uncharacterized protein n=1 Tax=Sinorhizobium chiapasense TaxID=501572 RepID=A0ABZ2BAU5_9HYPH
MPAGGRATTVTALAQEAEERAVKHLFDRARHIDVDRKQAIESLESMARSKVWWLQTHGPRRPAHDVAKQEHHLAVLVQTLDVLKDKERGTNAADDAR